MTAECRTAQKLREALEREYALLSYRLPYMSDGGYSKDEEQNSESVSEQWEERHETKVLCPLREYEELEVYKRVRLVWRSVRARRVL